MAEQSLGFFAYCDPARVEKMGEALKTKPLLRYVRLTIRNVEIIWDRSTSEVWSRSAPAKEPK